MHDGAVIIPGGRIYATRVHVPLSEITTLRELGTRHRAAIGASEIKVMPFSRSFKRERNYLN